MPGMPRRLLLLLLVIMLAASACTPREEELRGLRTCGELVAGDEFGTTPVIEGADVILFSRPGQFSPEEARGVSGLEGDVLHVSRSIGPCGQHDLFFGADGATRCVAVVGRIFASQTCWDASVESPAVFALEVSEDINGTAVVIWAPGIGPSHVLLSGESMPVTAAFIRNSVALAVLPTAPSEVLVVGADGTTTPAHDTSNT